jgi:hypothetical protein
MRRLSAFLFMIPLLGVSAVPAAAQSLTEELLSGMVTEEVEPGVYRVVSDGVHDLTPDNDIQELGFPSHFVDVAPDGGVWLSGGDHGGDGLYRLGEDRSYGDPGESWGPTRHQGFAPDGTLWSYDGDSIRTFTDGVWVVRPLHGLDLHDLATGLDGDAWVVAEDAGGDGRQGRAVLRLARKLDGEDPYQRLDGWAALTDADGWPESIEVAADGSIWLLGLGWHDRWLLRYDGQGWNVVDAPTSILRGSELRDLVAGPDGSLWLVGTRWPNEGPQPGPALARLDRSGWTTFGDLDAGFGWGQMVGVFFGSHLLDVAPDGALWPNISTDLFAHAGVARFDGVTWQRFLDGRTVHDLDAGPDGSVWVRAEDASTDGQGPIHTYVITPEAVQ